MTRKANPLTNTQVQKTKADPDKITRLYDGNGLHLAISPKGVKTWYVSYTHPTTGKKNQSHKIGRYPAISLADARTLTADVQELLAQGIDPSTHAKTQKLKAQNKILMNAFADEYLAYITPHSKPRTIKGDKQRIDKDIKPLLGHIAIDEITKDDIRAMADSIERRTKPNGQPPRETTRRTLAIVGRILKLAKVRGLVGDVVGADVLENYPKIKGEHFKFVEIDALPRLLQDISTYQGDTQTRLAMRFLAYTFCRTGEMRFLQWKHIDWVEQVWNVDISTLKRHARHKVPLSRQVMEILEQLKSITGGESYVFWNATTMQPYSENFVNNALKNMGYRGKQSGHGFRHIASTNLNELGYMGDAIERQMHHKGDNTIRAIYNHAEHMDERRDIMQAWANFLDMLERGERVSFRQARAMLDAQHSQDRHKAVFDKLKAKGLDDDEIRRLLSDLL